MPKMLKSSQGSSMASPCMAVLVLVSKNKYQLPLGCIQRKGSATAHQAAKSPATAALVAEQEQLQTSNWNQILN